MTPNVWVVLVPLAVSVAVTVIVDVSSWTACVVSMISVPLGLVDDSVAELIVSGLTGSVVFAAMLNCIHDRNGEPSG